METIKNETFARPISLAILHINIISALAFASSAALANDNIVVTATRTATPVASLLAQAAIITRDDIEAAGPISLVELLQRRAGIEIRATGGPGQTSSVFIRGANSNHTLVLVDGMRLGSSTTGAPAFENIPLDIIERIEVVKGPRSGLYGSDAIGGVIQIFTRRANKTSKQVTLGAGSTDTRNLNAAFNAVNGDTTYSLTAGYTKIDAPSATNPVAGSFTFNPDRDPTQNTNGKIGFAHRYNALDRVAIDVWQSRSKTRFDSGPGNLDTYNQQTHTGASIKSDNQFAPIWLSRLNFGQTIDDSRVTSAFPGKFKTTQQQLGWQNDLTLGAGTVIIGAERREEKVDSTTNYNRKERTTDSLFVATSQTFNAMLLSANIRRDREDQFGSRNTGGVSLGWQAASAHLLYVSAGNAFRAPSFNDLYFPGFSNALLQPEKSRSHELGWRYTTTGTKVNVAYFDNKIENLIAFDFVTSRPQNIQRATIKGWEANAEIDLFGLNWRAALTSQSPENALTGRLLRSRAKVFGTVGVSQTVGAWSWRADVVGNGARFDSANEASSSRMGGYALVNANLRYQLSPQWQLELVGNNLGDRRYELARGYNQLGRQLLLNIRLSM